MLLDASLRICLVAAVIGLILTAMRVRSNSTRHTVWTAVLCAMLLMPVLPSLVPSISVPVPAGAAEVLPYARAFPDQFDSTESRPIARGASDAVPVPQTAPREGTPGRTVASTGVAWPARSLATAVYLLGAAACFLRLFSAWLAMIRLSRSAAPVAMPCEAAVCESALVATPLTVGILSPKSILPADWPRWSDEKLRGCLAHELAHIKRHDPLVGFAAHINRCIFWFHPLAWWLERTLALAAENAADDAAVSELGHRRRYAELLLDIAETVRLRGGRVSWQGVGVDGTGLLGRRIDRVLREVSIRDMSRAHKAGVFVACAATILLIAACRRQPVPAPLQPDAEVAQRLEKEKGEQAFYAEARSMTAEQVNALEASLKRNPEDFDALKKLKIFYEPGSSQKVFGWNEMIERRRPHILWLIERHPEHELAVWRVSADADQVGYGEARTRWLAQTAKPDATAKVLNNAAHFFMDAEPRLSEELMLRAKTLDPEGRTVARTAGSRDYWAYQLGNVYARVISGPRSPQNGRPLTPFDSDPYAREVRRRVMESDDAAMLVAVGQALARTYRDEDRQRLGRQLLERALQINPQQHSARRLLVSLEDNDRNSKLRRALRIKAAELAGGELPAKLRDQSVLSEDEARKLKELEERALEHLPEADRFAILPGLAGSDYMMAENFNHTKKDKGATDAAWARSKRYAQQTLALADKFREHADYGWAVYHARIALGAHALREGDKDAAVRYMLEAANGPASSSLDERFFFGLDTRLVNYLLKEGERESVAQFLEKSAGLRSAERDRLLTDAAAIRAGRMPMSYQYMVTRSE
jgi:beta-lactamase regulating signal transducer with metallopeptidase domain